MFAFSHFVVFAITTQMRNMILRSTVRAETKVILQPLKMAFTLRETLPYFPAQNLTRIQV